MKTKKLSTLETFVEKEIKYKSIVSWRQHCLRYKIRRDETFSIDHWSVEGDKVHISFNEGKLVKFKSVDFKRLINDEIVVKYGRKYILVDW